MGNIFRRDWSGGWYPSADAVNAGPNVVLRGDNVTLDDEGIISLRPGSSKINATPLADTDIHSLHTAVIGGTRYRMTGAGNKVYANSTDLSVTFAGSGDVAMNDGFGHVFMARSTTKKKHDGTDTTNWGIAKPTHTTAVDALDPISKTVATCDSTESPAFTANEGTITGTYPDGADGTSNGSIELTPATTGTGRATITKTFTSDQDFLNIGGNPGDDRDLFDMLAWVSEPERLEKVTVMFGLGTGSDPFQDDHYWFDFNFGSVRSSVVDLKDTSVHQNVAATTINTKGQIELSTDQEGTSAHRPAQRPGITQGELDDKIQERREQQEERRRERKDRANNPGWTHYSCLRGQFNRTGTTSGRNWSTVRALKIIYKAQAGASGVVRFDTVRWIGGALDGALTGTYQFRWRGVKDHTTFVEMSPMSPASAAVEFVGQRARVHLTFEALDALDSQADTIWFYFLGGILDRWYRCGVSNKIAKYAFRIDEFARAADGSLDATDRARFTGFGFSVPTTYTLKSDLTVDLTTNEVEAMAINESYQALETTPPDDIVGFVPDYFERFFVLAQASGDDGYLWISERRKPGVYRYGYVLRVGNSSETLYWIRRTTGGLYIGTSRDIYVVTGDAAELPDGTLDLRIQAINIDSPPVDVSAAAEGNKIIYRASDGYRLFDGVSSAPVPRQAVELLHRGFTRYGVSPLNLTTGRHRAALSKDILTLLAPEGASTTSTSTLYRVKFGKGQWERATYPNAFTCLHREPDGTVIAGDTSGFVWVLDTGTADGATAISPVVWTKADDDGLPLNKKDPFDITLQMDTGNSGATVAIHLDGSGSAASSFTVTCNGMAYYKRNVSALSAFRQAQFRISGALAGFKLYLANLAYRPRPQQRMYVDTGYVKVDRQDVTWLREARLMVNSPVDLTVVPYFDDTAGASYTLTATANKAKVYTVPMGREEKGSQPRLTIATTSSAGTTEPLGFELYWVEFGYKATGNASERKTLRVYGDAL